MAGLTRVPVAVVTVWPAGLRRYGEIRRLMPPYLRELAAVSGTAPLPAPRYPGLAAYWLLPGRHAFVIAVDGESAGFALVNRWSPSGQGVDHSMAEFYIAPPHRRRGIGKVAALRLFVAMPGLWEISVLPANTAALQFWRATVSSAVGARFEQIEGDGIRWQGPILRFTSG